MIQRWPKVSDVFTKTKLKISLIIRMMVVGKSHFETFFMVAQEAKIIQNHLPTLKNTCTSFLEHKKYKKQIFLFLYDTFFVPS